MITEQDYISGFTYLVYNLFYYFEFTCRYSKRRGIDLGDISILVYVEELQGKRYILDKSGHRSIMILEKQWSASPTPFPLQVVVCYDSFY